jgi:toxin ParE1/3/4
VKLAWTPEARADRRAIYAYIESNNPRAALALDARFTERAAQLVTHPFIGRPGRVPDTRELVAHPNYILIYDVVDQRVRILRLLHAAQQWPPVELENEQP